MQLIERNIWKHFMGRCFWKTASNLIWLGRESQSGSSKADFANKVRISLREMRESNYWLRIIKELFPKTENIVYLVGESEELGKILASILIKSRNWLILYFYLFTFYFLLYPTFVLWLLSFIFNPTFVLWLLSFILNII
jgi:hypothetical protein